jgi:putative membrane protein insertion efficiency factor
MSPVARMLVGAIGAYRGLRYGRPSGCRFLPSCSEYAVEAITNHGAWSGSLYAMRRLSRCHPLGGHGFDPVPD